MKATGKDHARVNLAIWGDDDFLDLRVDEQALYFALWTSPGLSYCGAGGWHPGRIASLSADWTIERIEQAAAGLSSRLFLLIDTFTDEYLLRSWMKHDGLWKTPNMAVSMANARAEIASRTLRAVVVHEVRRLRDAHPGSASWTRPAVVSMLEQKAIDPASLDPFTPTLTPDLTPGLTPPPTPAVTPPLTLKAGVGVNPPSNPGPTPAPAPAPISLSPKGAQLGGNVTCGDGDGLPLNPSIPRCEIHADDPAPPPCGACADTRRSMEAAEADHAARAVARRRQEMEDRAAAERAEIAACGMCDDRGYQSGRVCGHDPDVVERAAVGIAKARAALSAVGVES